MIVKRNHWKQWEAETHVDLGDQRELQIFTYKKDKGLKTIAFVGIRGEHSFTTKIGPGGDYHRVLHEIPVKRVTEKAITQEHQYCVDRYLSFLRDDIADFYKWKQ